MSDPEPIDLSQLQNLSFAPDWAGDLQKRESSAGEVIWGRAPDNEREARGGGQGSAFGNRPGGGGGRGPRRDGGGGFGGGRPDYNRPGGPPRGPRSDDRGPRPENRGPRPAGGPGGPGGFGGPPRGPRPDDQRGGPRPDRPYQGGDRGPRPGGPRPEGGGRPPFRRDDRRDGGGDRRNGPPHGQGHGHGPRRFDDRPHIEPLPGWRTKLLAEPKSLEAIVRQIKASGRAYPVFELGRLFLAGRDRYLANFSRLPAPQPPRNLPKGAPVPEVEPLGGPDELFYVTSDHSLWLSREEAIRHLLQGPSLKEFYRRETVSVDPPKGIFTAVAVCGFSGTILGPPNHHSFQSAVAKLHREEFYNLPIDRYKARIRTEKDPELVNKWLEEQSTATVYIPLTAEEIAANRAARAEAKARKQSGETEAAASSEATGATAPETPDDTALPQTHEESPAEPPVAGETEAAEISTPSTAEESAATGAPEADAGDNAGADPEAAETATVEADAGETPSEADPEAGSPAASGNEAPAAEPLKSRAAMEAHFIAHHAPAAIQAVTRISVPGNIPGKLLAPPLLALLRVEVEQQQRFPMQLVQDLCRDLEKEGLKFFKRDKKATFVCRTRPHFIEDETHLSPRLRSIVGVVKANPGLTVAKLVSTLAPHTAPAGKQASTPAPVEDAAPAAETAPFEASPATETAQPAPETAVETPAPVDEAVPVTETPSPAPEEASAPAAGSAPETAAPDATAESEPAAAAAEPAAAATASGTPPENKPDRQRRGKGPKKPPVPEGPPAPLTMEEIGVLQDLRWLVQEGFVTEYASGELQILGRPPQPHPPAGKKKGESADSPAGAALTESPAAAQPEPEGEAGAPPADPTETAPEETAAAPVAESSPDVPAGPESDGTDAPAAAD